MDETTEILPAPALPPPPPAPEPIVLDPFAFFPKRKSVLGDFGGTDHMADPSYAFHSHYLECGPGTVAFTIHLTDLAATCGTLSIRVNVLPSDHRSDAKTMKTAQIPLDRFAEAGGRAEFRIVARPGMLYAILGQILDETDVRTSGMTITLDRADDGSITVEELVEARHSVFGGGAWADVPHLLSPRRPTLAWPVSQRCTDRQLAEPAFAEATAALGERPERDRRVWERAFALQALTRYGMLQPGAIGVGFGVADDALPAAMAARDCRVTRVVDPGRQPAEALAALSRPALCPDARLAEHVAIVAAEPAGLPPDLRGIDYLWSIGTLGRMDSFAAAFEFVERSTLRLAAGGVAVHLLDLRLDDMDIPEEAEEQLVFRRPLLERLTLKLLAAAHDVCQIRYDGARFGAYGRKSDPAMSERRCVQTIAGMRVTSFGLVVRRGAA